MRLGELLLSEGLITARGLEEALESQVVHGGRLGTNLVELGLVQEKELARVLGKQHGCAFAAGEMAPDAKALELVDKHFSDEKDLLPMRVDGTRLSLAVTNPRDLESLDAIAFKTAKRVVPVVIPEFRMNQLLRRYCKAFRAMRAVDMNTIRPSKTLGTIKEEGAFGNSGADLMSEEEFQSVYAQALSGGREHHLETAVSEPEEPVLQGHVLQGQEPGAPVEELAAPVDELTAPIDELEVEVSAPVEEPAARVDEPTAPVEELDARVDEPTAPVEELDARVDEPTAPVDDLAAPVDELSALIDEFASPGEEPIIDGLALSLEEPISASPVEPPVPEAVAPEPPRRVATPAAAAEAPPVWQPVPSAARPVRLSSAPPRAPLPPPVSDGSAPVAARAPVARAPVARAPEPTPEPLTFPQAQALLSQSLDREDIARTVLRFAVGKWKRTLLLSVQGDLLTGWQGLGEGIRRQAIQRIGVALRGGSTFKLVRDTRSHYVGPVRRDAGTAVFYKLLGGGHPTTAVMLPLLVRGKVVHILYVDNGPDELTPPDVGELLILSQSVGRSYEQLMKRRKSA